MRIDPPFLHDPAVRKVLAALPAARIVGGAVRDALLDRPVADIDLATPDPPDRQVELTNGLTLHYYTETRPHYPLKPGQPVKVCLVNIATYCGSRQVNTRTYLLHQLHDAYRRRPQMLPDTVDPCARER